VPITHPGPLRGVRILELSAVATGPYAVAILADQGAQVIKVERPGIGDIARWFGTQTGGISAVYQMCNRGKRCIAVNLDDEEGRELVRELAAGSDVVVQNWRPGVAERLGLGYDDLREDDRRTTDLVYVSISGFGSEGPYAPRGAYDTVIQAYAGIGTSQADSASGPGGTHSATPRFVRQVLADKVTALSAAQAITAALFARAQGDGGQHVRLSMLDALVSFVWVDVAGNEVLPDVEGFAAGSVAADTRAFRFLDGWGVTTPTSDADYAAMCQAFGVEGYDDPRVATAAARARHRDVSRAISDRWHEVAATLTTAQAVERFEAHRVPYGLVLSPAELVEDPHAVAIGLFVEDHHPVAGRVRMPRHAAQFSATPAHPGAPAPTIGQHTDEILVDMGREAQIPGLRARRIVT
jgi:crotonobetainyl-CoA:carnitine CoA-transferase CaiB-like acyl-CoA transferase